MRHRKPDTAMLAVILTLAWPTMLEQLMQTAVQYIDTAMVGSLGTSATAAVGATSTVNWLVNSSLSALGVGFLAFIARALGAGENGRARRAAMQAVLAVLCMGTLFTAVTLSMSGVILGKRPSFPNAAASVYPLFTCLLPMSMFMMMMNATYGQVPGIALITMAFAVAFCCDAAAYFGGRAFGKRKLCPMISPKKTVEGAVFGFLGGLLGALVIRWVFIHVFRMAMPGIPATVVLGLLGSFAGQIGDLTASLLKRYSGIKDYGNVFPGHGGVMDRFDSVIFTLIVLYCYTLVL